MYLIVSKNTQYYADGDIGNEIHISRPILIYLLTHHYINRSDIVVTKSRDRFFMYDNLFDNVIEYVNIPPDSDVVDLVPLYLWIHWPYGGDINNVLQRFPVINDIKNNLVIVKGFEFMQNIWNFRYVSSIAPYAIKDFIMINHVGAPIDDNNKKNERDIEIIGIINKILYCYPNLNIIVFIRDEINFIHSNVYYIRSLEEYTSLMKHQLCKCVISRWSGYGQLAQQCHDRIIIYFGNQHELLNYCNNKDNILNIAGDINNIFNSWDFKIYSNTKMYIYPEL